MAYIQVPPQSTGEKVSISQVNDGVNNVDRQEVVLASPTNFAARADVVNVDPGVSDYGAVVRPATSGSQVFHLVVAAGNNPTLIKGAPGKITGWHIFNNTGVPLYVKFHDVAVSPTAGQAVKYTVGIQAGLPDSLGAEIHFATGIGITITEGIADADVSTVQANVCVINIHYE